MGGLTSFQVPSRLGRQPIRLFKVWSAPICFKGADFFVSLVPVCEMVSGSFALPTSWAVVRRQRWHNMLERRQGFLWASGGSQEIQRDAPRKTLQRHTPKTSWGEGHILSTLKVSTVRPRQPPNQALWKPVSRGTSQRPETALKTRVGNKPIHKL